MSTPRTFPFYGDEEGYREETPITDYANVRKTGLAAINLREDDELIEVKKTDNNQGYFPLSPNTDSVSGSRRQT